ncbi:MULTISPECIES: hypothetical protein [Flavobacterium]|jgi:hypothetical protein|uniref:DUF2541 family protein n=1 Tax=Flavobacterium cupriresistens TaxID=2893885 RepID=A0ABU4RF73_9FLAO|nr:MULTISPECIES: hypothetical protein [unclassified Flavobacterium]MDX6191254.1 hypothetical protein [Flavobacterium sp. Fl-318]UFH42427.1 hypothetical protein LNP23_21790 [Flavobacterium sp. F-323]
MKKILVLGMILLAVQLTTAQKVIRKNNNVVNNNNVGSWRVIGSRSVTHNADHDKLDVTHRDSFRKLKLKVTDSPLNMQKMVVDYESGAPENIELRQNIAKGGESRVIDLRGGKRKIKAIHFWYDTKGFLNGKAEVTVFGMK